MLMFIKIAGLNKTYYINKGNEMNIYELIETAHLERNNLNDDLRKQILNAYPFDKWIEVGVGFLKGLDRRHQIPGGVVFVLTDMLAVDQRDIPLTPKQKWYFVNTLIDYWDQMSCEAKSDLPI